MAEEDTAILPLMIFHFHTSEKFRSSPTTCFITRAIGKIRQNFLLSRKKTVNPLLPCRPHFYVDTKLRHKRENWFEYFYGHFFSFIECDGIFVQEDEKSTFFPPLFLSFSFQEENPDFLLEKEIKMLKSATTRLRCSSGYCP